MNSNADVTVSAPNAICNPVEFGTKDDALQKWTIVGLLSFGAIIAYVSRSNLAVALTLPSFIHSFGLSETGRGEVNSSFFWAYAALQIPAGWVVDRYGVKWSYALCLLFWCLASAGTCLVTTLDQLILLRLLVGAGEAVSVPASARWVRTNFPERRRGLAMGLYMTGTKIGPAIGAPLAVWLLTNHSWRSMFFILGIGGLLWLIPWIWIVKDQRPDRHSTKSARTVLASRLKLSTIIASPVIWGTVIATFSYMYFVYYCLTWMPAYLTEQRHLSLSQMGMYTFFGFGGMAVVAALAGWMADFVIGKGGNPVTVRKWFTIVGFAFAGTELIGAQSSSLAVALTFSIISLSGLGLATANYWALTQTLIPAPAIGRISGIQNCAASIAGVVAPIFTGWLKQRTGSYHAPMFGCFAFLVVGVLSYLFMVKSRYAPRPGL